MCKVPDAKHCSPIPSRSFAHETDLQTSLRKRIYVLQRPVPFCGTPKYNTSAFTCSFAVFCFSFSYTSSTSHGDPSSTKFAATMKTSIQWKGEGLTTCSGPSTDNAIVSLTQMPLWSRLAWPCTHTARCSDSSTTIKNSYGGV